MNFVPNDNRKDEFLCIWFVVSFIYVLQGNKNIFIVIVIVIDSRRPGSSTQMFSKSMFRVMGKYNLNQCYLLSNKLLETNFIDIWIFLQENECDKVVWRMSAILSQPPCINQLNQWHPLPISWSVGAVTMASSCVL